MKAIVIYTSQTGFTRRYAEEIARRLECEVRTSTGLIDPHLEAYDTVIYGGWLRGGAVMDLVKLRRRFEGKRLIVFTVGSTVYSEGLVERLRVQNGVEDIPFFYLRGGLQLEKLSFVYRQMLKSVQKALAKKKDAQPEEIEMARMLGASFDAVDLSLVEPILAAARGEAEEKPSL